MLGFIFGILQMVLYAMYKGKKDEKLPQVVIPEKPVLVLEEKQKLPKELTEEQIVDIVKLGSLICSDKIHVAACIQDKHQPAAGGDDNNNNNNIADIIATKPDTNAPNLQPTLQLV